MTAPKPRFVRTLKSAFYFFALMAILILSCKKTSTQQNTNGNPPPGPSDTSRVNGDSSILHLSNSINLLDSFSIHANEGWKLTYPTGSDAWFTTDITSGGMDSKIHVSILNVNLSDVERKAYLIISPTNAPVGKPDTVVIVQKSLTQEFPNRNAFGGLGLDLFYQVIPSGDGGWVATGVSASNEGDATGNHGKEDLWVIKFDAFGKKVWEHLYGGSQDDWGISITKTPQGGYLIAGATRSNDFDLPDSSIGNAWYIKLDPNGNKIWAKTFGTRPYTILSVVSASGGGYIMGGYTNTGPGQCVATRIDEDGNIVWEKIFQSGGFVGWVAPATDGGYVLTGATTSYNGSFGTGKGGFDAFLVKIDESGNLGWHNVFGGSLDDQAYFVSAATDGGYILSGYSNSADKDVPKNQGSNDILVIKTDINGNMIWTKTFGGSLSEKAYVGISVSGGGYLVGGTTSSNNGDISSPNTFSNGWLFKLDNSGTLVWEKSLGGSSGYETIYSAVESSPGKYILAGSCSSFDGDIIGLHALSSIDGWLMTYEHN